MSFAGQQHQDDAEDEQYRGGGAPPQARGSHDEVGLVQEGSKGRRDLLGEAIERRDEGIEESIIEVLLSSVEFRVFVFEESRG